MWNFKGTLWNSTQNILLIHWKIRFLYNIGILRALRFKSPYAFLKRPPVSSSKSVATSTVIIHSFSTIHSKRMCIMISISSQRRMYYLVHVPCQITKFMGLTWGPLGSCRPQMGLMLAPWTLRSGIPCAGVYHVRIDEIQPTQEVCLCITLGLIHTQK